MKYQGTIDLRKSDPLNIESAFVEMRNRWRRINDPLNQPDTTKPGWIEQQKWLSDERKRAATLHNLLLSISDLLGPEITSKVEALAWVKTHNAWNGQPLTCGGTEAKRG